MALKDAAAYALVGRITRAAAGKGHARIGLAQLYLLLLSCAAVLSVGMFRGTGPAARARVEEDALVEIASVGRLPRSSVQDCGNRKGASPDAAAPATLDVSTEEVHKRRSATWRKDWHPPGIVTKGIPPTALRWTPAASELVHGLLQAQQFPDSCADTKWLVVEMDLAGLMWNYHAFLRALIIGLQTGRTVIPIARSPSPGYEWESAAFAGCENLHLGCFFEITNCTAEHLHRKAELLRASPMVPSYQWPFKNVTTREALAREEVLRARAFKGWEYDWRYTFPAGLWDLFVSRGMVYFEERDVSVERASSEQRQFMLFTLVSSWLFNPVPRVRGLADKMMSKYEHWRPPVVGLHIRRGDKMAEDPYWVAHKAYRPASDYGKRIRARERARGFDFAAVFVASDSATVIDTIAADPGSVGLRPDIGVMYDWEKSVALLEAVDEHTHVPGDKKRDLQDKLVASLYAMVEVSEYVVCNLSSNICRFLWTAMGAKKRLEQIGFQGELGSSLDPPQWYGQWKN